MHHVLPAHAAFIGPGTFQGKLYNLGRYPGAVASTEASDRVVGEVYALRREKHSLESLDAYEGNLFRRERVSITLITGDRINAWIYLYVGPIEGQPVIPGGDYVTFLNRS